MLVAGGTGAAPSWYRGAYGSLAAHHKILALSSPASSVPFCFSPCQKAWKKKKKKKGKVRSALICKAFYTRKFSSPTDEQGWLGGRQSEQLPCLMRSWYRTPKCLPRLQCSSILQLLTPTMENSVCVLNVLVTPAWRRLQICCRTA